MELLRMQLGWDLFWIVVGLGYAILFGGAVALCRRFVLDDKKRQYAEWIIAGAGTLTTVSYTFMNHTKTMFFEYAMIAMVVTVSMYWCTCFQISKSGYLLIFGLLMVSTTHGYKMLVEDFTIYPVTVLLLLLMYSEQKTMRNSWMRLWAGIMVFILHLVWIRKLFYLGFKDAYWHLSYVWKASDIIRGMFFVIVGLLFLLLSAVVVRWEKKILIKWFDKIMLISQKYRGIDYLFLGALILDCVMLGLADELYVLMNQYVVFEGEVKLYKLIEIGLLLILAIQVSYIILIVKVNEQKVIIQKQDMQQMDMKLYHQRLEENMNEIRAVKHDLKNVFLTMGEYVKRSDDEELKTYYEEAICPLADKEIRMNDCFVALENIASEHLRAFMYYKISYGIAAGIDMRLITCNKNDEKVWLPEQWDFMEKLIRIMGIWIDNAIEECQMILLQEGTLAECIISIKQDEDNIQIKVENSVRDSVMEKGICVGMTTKGIGRGNGLQYAQRMIDDFENCVGNAYFKNQRFVQSMLLDMKGKG